MKFAGVYVSKSGQITAKVTVRGTPVYLGSFPTVEVAGAAIDKVKKKLEEDPQAEVLKDPQRLTHARPWSEKRKSAHSKALFGHRVSDDFRAKTRQRMRSYPNRNFIGCQKGKKWNAERREAWGQRQRGIKRKPHTIASRQLMSRVMRIKRPRVFLDESSAARHSSAYKIWRDTVYARDDYTCRKCQKRGGRLNPHHLFGFAKHPGMRYEPNNGVTLCVADHKAFHKLYGKRNNTPDQFDLFINLNGC